MGLRPDGLSSGQAPSAHAANIVDHAWAAIDWTLGRALRTRRFWWLAAGYFCGLFSWYAVQVHQTKYLIEIGFAPGEAAWALGLVSLVAVPGQIALGHLSDRIGREWVWMIGNLGFVICYVCLIALRSGPTPVLLYAMIVAQGALGYGLTSVMGPIPAEIFAGRLAPHQRHEARELRAGSGACGRGAVAGPRGDQRLCGLRPESRVSRGFARCARGHAETDLADGSSPLHATARESRDAGPRDAFGGPITSAPEAGLRGDGRRRDHFLRPLRSPPP